MNPLHPLKYLTVDLFLYDLGEGLGQDTEQLQQNRHNFWQRIYPNSLTETKLADLQAEERSFSNYIELLGTQRYEPLKPPLDGFYYPVKLNDTYALQIDCSGQKNDPGWEQLSQAERLQQLKQIILDHRRNTPGEMGETWLIWGQLTDAAQTAEDLAKTCYTEIQIVERPNWQRDLKGQGNIQDATLFQLEQKDLIPDGQNQTHQIFICLFPHDRTKEEIIELIGRLYRHFIQLFHYRNKILWVYEQSRQLKIALKKSSSPVQKLVNLLPQRLATSLDLNQLQQDLATALQVFHDYANRLGDLQEQCATIEINTRNYQKRIEAIAQQNPQSDLEFLKAFGEFGQTKLDALKTEYQTFSVGLKPLENFITTIQGIIEIEKTKNERNLNTTVAIASVGISTASLAATTFTFEQAKGIVAAIS
ncbi:MAG: hypothetical protein SVX43_10070, partial [Cyanobacteriota bacterium]|nr:hypothetical protein [Cyanobacteriota bacterium]